MGEHSGVIQGGEPTDHQLDRAWLGQWIQPQHLTDEALDRYHAEYESGPVPILQVSEFLRPEISAQLHALLAEEAEFEDVYVLRVPDSRVEREVWIAAEDSNRASKYSRLVDVQGGAMSFNPLTYIRLHEALADRRFVEFFERITNTPLGSLQAFGGKAFGVGDYLRPHHDQGNDRLLAFIVYVNPNWRPSYGGALNVQGVGGERLVLEAEYNSLVCFNVLGHECHYVANVEEAAGAERRLTVGGWIKKPDGEA